MLPKSLYLGQPCRQSQPPPFHPKAASCRPVARDQLWKLRPLPIGSEPGSQHVCRSHLQGSLNYQTTTLMPVRSASYICGAQLTMQLSPPHTSNTKHGLLELSLHRISGTYHGARVVPSSAPAPACQGCGSMWSDSHKPCCPYREGCLVPLSWVCGWNLREDGVELFLLAAELIPCPLDFSLSTV